MPLHDKTMNIEKPQPVLPYTDSKPVGAADFYFAINATFKFIQAKLGSEGLRRYWRDMGEIYYVPVGLAWKAGGLPAVAAYWRAFFKAEPGAEVEVVATHENVTLDVRICPAINHLRTQGREIFPGFCQHCYHVSAAIGTAAGLTVRVNGGNGSCRQIFSRRRDDLPGQDFNQIKEAK